MNLIELQKAYGANFFEHTIDIFQRMTEALAQADPESYDTFWLQLHESVYGYHFSEETALVAVRSMLHTTNSGEMVCGEFFGLECARDVKQHYLQRENEYDIYVALNETYHSCERMFSRLADDIPELLYVDAMTDFWFNDEDSSHQHKVWDILKTRLLQSQKG